MRSNLYYTSLKYTDDDYILEVDVDAYQKKYKMDKKMYEHLKFSPKVLYHPLLIYHMINHANETKNKLQHSGLLRPKSSPKRKTSFAQMKCQLRCCFNFKCLR